LRTLLAAPAPASTTATTTATAAALSFNLFRGIFFNDLFFI
jgi:hypothetical protein